MTERAALSGRQRPSGRGRDRCRSSCCVRSRSTVGRRLEGHARRRLPLLALRRVGTELAQVRPYVAGDDVRQIEWNVTARTGEPHVRVNLAERVLVTWLVLDTSPSMQFGTAERRKADVADGVAIAVGHVATRRGNRLGVITFGDARRRRCRPRQGRHGLLGLLADAAAGAGAGGGRRDLARRGAEPHRTRSRGSAAIVVVVSDFRGPLDWRLPLLQLLGRHDVLAVEIRDPREQELPDVGELWLVDPETGRQIRVDTRSEGLRERFAAAAAEERSGVARVLSSLGVPHVVLSTSGDWLRALAAFLGGRAGELRAPGRRCSRCSPCRCSPALWLCNEQRRAASAARFSSLGAAAEPRLAARPGRRRYIPLGLLLLALVALIVGMARPHANLTRAAQSGDRRARDRHLPIDDGDGRRRRRGSTRAQGRVRVPRARCRRRTASRVVGLRQPRLRRRPAHARPHARRDRARRSEAGPGHRDRRRRQARGRSSGRRQRAIDGAVPPTSVLLHLRRRPGRRPHDGARRERNGRRRCTCRCSTVLVGTPSGVVTAAAHRRLHGADPRAAEPRHPAADRADQRRRVLPRAHERRG